MNFSTGICEGDILWCVAVQKKKRQGNALKRRYFQKFMFLYQTMAKFKLSIVVISSQMTPNLAQYIKLSN